MKQRFKRTHFYLLISFFLLLSVLLTACGQTTGSSADKQTINIGYQKNGTTLTLKQKQELQKELEGFGYEVKWSEFNTGSSILEALNTGSIDFANAGDIPSIFALSKGSDFKYIAGEPSSPSSQGILVSKDSGIQSVEDLKGKKIAFNKASISQYLLTQSLHSVGLKIDDIEPVFLNPPDASIAFEKGEVDAWVVWDPYLTVAESNGNVILEDIPEVPFRSFYFATSKFAEDHPDIVELYVKHVAKVGEEIDKEPAEAAKLLEEATNIPTETWVTVLNRKTNDVHYMDQQAIDDLQAQADNLVEIGLTNQKVEIKDHGWFPEDEKE